MGTEKIIGNLKKVSKKLHLAATAIVIAYTVYTLIPKSEKIKGINEEGFLNKN